MSEPVAWMHTTICSWVSTFIHPETQPEEWIPLYTHPAKEQYKFGVDWSKNGNAVTVLKIHEDGVAEVVFMDYQEVTHPAKTLTDDAKYNVTVKWDGKTTHHENVSLDTPLHYNEPKTLTDEEISIETRRALEDLNGSDYQLIDVSKLIAQYLMQAILKKASEK
jgi:hypothetical protein